MIPSAHSYEQPEISTRVREGRYFYAHQRRTSRSGVIVVCGGRETCAPDYAIDRPTFPYFGVEWVERGRGRLWLGGRRHELEPGAVFCYGPGIPCRIETDPRLPLTKYFVDITGPDTPALLARATLAPGQYRRILGVTELAELFDGMRRESTRHGASERGHRRVPHRPPAQGQDEEDPRPGAQAARGLRPAGVLPALPPVPPGAVPALSQHRARRPRTRALALLPVPPLPRARRDQPLPVPAAGAHEPRARPPAPLRWARQAGVL